MAGEIVVDGRNSDLVFSQRSEIRISSTIINRPLTGKPVIYIASGVTATFKTPFKSGSPLSRKTDSCYFFCRNSGDIDIQRYSVSETVFDDVPDDFFAESGCDGKIGIFQGGEGNCS